VGSAGEKGVDRGTAGLRRKVPRGAGEEKRRVLARDAHAKKANQNPVTPHQNTQTHRKNEEVRERIWEGPEVGKGTGDSNPCTEKTVEGRGGGHWGDEAGAPLNWAGKARIEH